MDISFKVLGFPTKLHHKLVADFKASRPDR